MSVNSSASVIACPARSRARGTAASWRAGRRRAASRAACRAAPDVPARMSSSSCGTSLELERPDVDAVDRGHRRDVARAEALERAHVEVCVVAGRLADGREQRVGAAQRARDVRADVDAVPADRARSRACRRSSRPTPGRRASPASRTRPARSPRASTSRARAARRAAPAAPPSGARGSAPWAPRSSRAAPPGPPCSPGRGSAPGPSPGRPAGPSRDAGALGEDGGHLSIPPRIGSSIATVAIMSAM